MKKRIIGIGLIFLLMIGVIFVGLPGIDRISAEEKFSPHKNEQGLIGESDKRWRKGYFKDLDVSTDLTLPTGSDGQLLVTQGTAASTLKTPSGDILFTNALVGTIQANAVGSSEIINNSVATGDILNGTITSTDIAVNTVSSANILNSTIASTDLADEAVTPSKIQNCADAQILVGLGTESPGCRTIGTDATLANTGALSLTTDVVAQTELKYEVATVVIASGALGNTATVTSGSIIMGMYLVSGDGSEQRTAAVASTTLTLTSDTATDAITTYTVVLLKS